MTKPSILMFGDDDVLIHVLEGKTQQIPYPIKNKYYSLDAELCIVTGQDLSASLEGSLLESIVGVVGFTTKPNVFKSATDSNLFQAELKDAFDWLCDNAKRRPLVFQAIVSSDEADVDEDMSDWLYDVGIELINNLSDDEKSGVDRLVEAIESNMWEVCGSMQGSKEESPSTAPEIAPAEGSILDAPERIVERTSFIYVLVAVVKDFAASVKRDGVFDLEQTIMKLRQIKDLDDDEENAFDFHD
ncbi:hypothetical protein HDU96_007891 [Phlyctochytrium bullatum]|nr:hypothetical protein HDU96_007891 [Phlyctochytrium bullatum]